MVGDGGGNTEGQNIGPTAAMAGRRVDFGNAGEGKGLAWGVEVDIDITNGLVRSRFQEGSFKIPKRIKKITFLDLAPQEALSPELRTVRSSLKPVDKILDGSSLISVATPAKQGKPEVENIREGLRILRPEDEVRFKTLQGMINWALGNTKGKRKFSQILEQYKGDTLVIVHGHSGDLRGMGEQYPDEVKDGLGNIIQRKGNFTTIDEILEKYNDPDKFAAVVLHGCNDEKESVKAKKVPVFYPLKAVKLSGAEFLWSKPGGVALPQ